MVEHDSQIEKLNAMIAEAQKQVEGLKAEKAQADGMLGQIQKAVETKAFKELAEHLLSGSFPTIELKVEKVVEEGKADAFRLVASWQKASSAAPPKAPAVSINGVKTSGTRTFGAIGQPKHSYQITKLDTGKWSLTCDGQPDGEYDSPSAAGRHVTTYQTCDGNSFFGLK